MCEGADVASWKSQKAEKCSFCQCEDVRLVASLKRSCRLLTMAIGLASPRRSHPAVEEERQGSKEYGDVCQGGDSIENCCWRGEQDITTDAEGDKSHSFEVRDTSTGFQDGDL